MYYHYRLSNNGTVNLTARYGNKNNNKDNCDDEINHFDSGEECVAVVAGPNAFNNAFLSLLSCLPEIITHPTESING